MKRILVTPLLVLVLAACGHPSDEAGDAKVDPVKVVRNEKTHTTELTLTSQAARRLDIKREAVKQDGAHVVIPYAAVLYTADGKTWVFTSRGNLRFTRVPVVVSEIRGDSVILASGPVAGTNVVTTGAAELLGAESGVGEE